MILEHNSIGLKGAQGCFVLPNSRLHFRESSMTYRENQAGADAVCHIWLLDHSRLNSRSSGACKACLQTTCMHVLHTQPNTSEHAAIQSGAASTTSVPVLGFSSCSSCRTRQCLSGKPAVDKQSVLSPPPQNRRFFIVGANTSPGCFSREILGNRAFISGCETTP